MTYTRSTGMYALYLACNESVDKKFKDKLRGIFVRELEGVRGRLRLIVRQPAGNLATDDAAFEEELKNYIIESAISSRVSTNSVALLSRISCRLKTSSRVRLLSALSKTTAVHQLSSMQPTRLSRITPSVRAKLCGHKTEKATKSQFIPQRPRGKKLCILLMLF